MTSEALPNPQEFEKQTEATTTSKHGNELRLIIELLNRYIDGLNILGSFTPTEDNDLKYAWILLTTRSFNSLLCAFNLLKKGYYSQTMTLLRSVNEDWLTATDCEKNPKTLSALLHGDSDFWRQEGRYLEMAKRISKEFPENWRKLYGSLSAIAHACNTSLKILVNPDTNELSLGSHYDATLFVTTYATMLRAGVIMLQFLASLIDANNPWHTETLSLIDKASAEIARIRNKAEKESESANDNPKSP